MCVVKPSVNIATRTQIIKCIVVLLIQCPDININKVFAVSVAAAAAIAAACALAL